MGVLFALVLGYIKFGRATSRNLVNMAGGSLRVMQLATNWCFNVVTDCVC